MTPKQIVTELIVRFGMTQKEIAAHVGVNQSTVTRWKAGADSTDGKVEKLRALYATATGDSPIAQRPVSYAILAGNVAAGVWFDDGDWDGSESIMIPRVPGQYANVTQSAYRVIGDSMNLAGIIDGGFVITVPYWQVRATIIDGDFVVVERHDSSRVERTVKVVTSESAAWRLEPRSSNQKHQPIVIPKGPVDMASHSRVEIIALVVGYYRDILSAA